MSTLTITLPTGASVCNGKQITFKAPCDATGVTGIIINSITYELVDASNVAISGGTFSSGAMVSVILDTGNYKAYVQNGKTTDIEMDSVPTSGSTNAVTSGGVYNAVQEMASANVVKLTQTEYDALTTKSDDTIYVITDDSVVDTTPTSGSANLITSGGVYNALNTKADKSTIVNKTLLASEWANGAAPYVYFLEISGVTPTSNQEIIPHNAITKEQLEALQGANLVGYYQDDGEIYLRAWGNVPTIDIPIRVIIRGDA